MQQAVLFCAKLQWVGRDLIKLEYGSEGFQVNFASFVNGGGVLSLLFYNQMLSRGMGALKTAK